MFRAFRFGLFCVEVEGEGQQVVNVFDDAHAVSAVEQHVEVSAAALLRFREHLAADAAGRDGIFGELSRAVDGGYGDVRRGSLWPAGVGVEHGAAFSAGAGRKRGVLLVAARHGLPVVEQQGCAYVEFGVGRVARFTGFLCLLHQFAQMGRQFLYLTFPIMDAQYFVLHDRYYLDVAASLARRNEWSYQS